MKRIIVRSLAAFLLLWGARTLAPATAQAQETESGTERVVVEVRDGKVFVNGEEREIGDNGRIILRRADGDEIVVVTEKDGPVWFSSVGFGERARADAERAREKAMTAYRMAMPGHNREFVMEFDPPVMPELEDLDIDLDIEGRLAEAFELQEGLHPNVFSLRVQSEELRELEREIRSKARELRHAEEAERAGIEAELAELVSQAFSMKLDQERKEIERLQERLSELQHRLQERETNRREIMERRKKDLLGRRDNLDW